MLGQNLTVLGNDHARRVALRPSLADEFEVIIAGYEADFLAIRLVVNRQTERPRPRPDLGLRELANREENVGQQRTRQSRKDVRLVLAPVDGPGDPRHALRIGEDAGVMAGRDEVGSHLLTVGPELAELEPDIAHDT